MSDIQLKALIFITSGALSFLSAPAFSLLLIPSAKRIGAIDVPKDSRRMHTRPIARIGGPAILLSFFLGTSLAASTVRPFFGESTDMLISALSIGGGVIVLGGLADDIYTLSPWQKIVYQCLAAVCAAACGVILFDGVLGVTVFLAYSVLLSNAFNLIDGLDGLAGGVAASVLVILALMTDGDPAAMLLLCALLGFLPLNMRPAKLFLGDSGAMLLGFSVSVISSVAIFDQKSVDAPIAIALALAVPLTDTVSSALRRLSTGKSPFSPDREHLHHRLVDGGLSHGRASLLLVMLSCGFSALGITVFYTGTSSISLILSSLLIFPTASVIIIGKRKKTDEC